MAGRSTPTPSSITAKEIDVSHIKGNLSDEEKRSAAKVLAYFVSTRDNSYGADVGQRLKFMEANVWDREGRAAYGETVFEIVVEKDMCNVFGILHGACAAYIVDPCSVSALVILGHAVGADGTGVSQSMNLIWHQAVRSGAKLRVVSTSMFIRGRVRTARCELWDGDKLCVSAIHSTINPKQDLLSKSKL
ncbi:hypothetical protein BDQ12DRAFT_675860 [Crucibulum laeve]|uniref:Thioesterase domain-containing protein n=1 Tax=Crucibulum laeve TaxID=68775 RepID=A0A5C3MRM8_9AGAR|nr:hypothetical protein BDQ12DRAFT_675860 [Crucibulum laeve]